MILTATSPSTDGALLQHRDIVTGEAIGASNVPRGAASSSTPVSKAGRAEQDDLLRTQPPEVAPH